MKWDERASAAANARRQLPRMVSAYFSDVRGFLAEDVTPGNCGVRLPQAPALYAGTFSLVLCGRSGRTSRRAEGIAGFAGRSQRRGGFGRTVARGIEAQTEGAQVSRRPGGGRDCGVFTVLERNLRCSGAGGVVDGFPGAPGEPGRYPPEAEAAQERKPWKKWHT